jgi:hypothetical protein
MTLFQLNCCGLACPPKGQAQPNHHHQSKDCHHSAKGKQMVEHFQINELKSYKMALYTEWSFTSLSRSKENARLSKIAAAQRMDVSLVIESVPSQKDVKTLAPAESIASWSSLKSSRVLSNQ